MVAGIIAAVLLTGASVLAGFVTAGPFGLIVGLVLGALIGAVFGWSIASAKSYDFGSPVGVLKYVVDITWSLPNTLVGSFFLVLNLVFGNRIDRTYTPQTGCVHLGKKAFPPYLTTIGTVIAGVDEDVHPHEHGHILQARIFGPFYLPAVVLNYIIASVLPFWWFYHDHKKYPIDGIGAYFLQGVYPHNWNEAWCYGVYGPKR